MSQTEIVNLEDLVPTNHNYRKFAGLWSFKSTERILKKLESENNYKGYGLLRLFQCLLLQFMEDLSDRELEKFLTENLSAKWFCGFSLSEPTPHFSLITKPYLKLPMISRPGLEFLQAHG